MVKFSRNYSDKGILVTLVTMVANHGSKSIHSSSGKFDNQKIDADINNHGDHGNVIDHIFINIGGCSGESLLILCDLNVIWKGRNSSNIRKQYLGESPPLCSAQYEQRGNFEKSLNITGILGSQRSVPLQAWSGPEGYRKLRFPDFMTTAQDGGKVVSLTHRPPLPPGNTPGTHFC